MIVCVTNKNVAGGIDGHALGVAQRCVNGGTAVAHVAAAGDRLNGESRNRGGCAGAQRGGENQPEGNELHVLLTEVN